MIYLTVALNLIISLCAVVGNSVKNFRIDRVLPCRILLAQLISTCCTFLPRAFERYGNFTAISKENLSCNLTIKVLWNHIECIVVVQLCKVGFVWITILAYISYNAVSILIGVIVHVAERYISTCIVSSMIPCSTRTIKLVRKCVLTLKQYVLERDVLDGLIE